MKKLRFTTTNIVFGPPGEPKNSSGLMLACLNNPSREGIDVVTMRKRIRVIDAIEAAKEKKKTTIEIEDADFETLKVCAASMRWGMVHKDILAFSAYIEKGGEPEKDEVLKKKK